MPADYTILAPFYDRIGMSDFATKITPRLLNFIQKSGWMGRRMIDLGCGTGTSVVWFSERGYWVMGVDNSPQMLEKARLALDEKSLNARLTEADMRSLKDVDKVDLVLALDVMNELDNLRSLEGVFKSVDALLSKDRYFVFDVHTIEGLAQRGLDLDSLVCDENDLVAFAHSHFDFERQIFTINYNLFRLDEGGLWQRSKIKRILRAFPIQAIASLLRRHNFEVVSVVNTRFEVVDFAYPEVPRAIIVAKKI